MRILMAEIRLFEYKREYNAIHKLGRRRVAIGQVGHVIFDFNQTSTRLSFLSSSSSSYLLLPLAKFIPAFAGRAFSDFFPIQPSLSPPSTYKYLPPLPPFPSPSRQVRLKLDIGSVHKSVTVFTL